MLNCFQVSIYYLCLFLYMPYMNECGCAWAITNLWRSDNCGIGSLFQTSCRFLGLTLGQQACVTHAFAYH